MSFSFLAWRATCLASSSSFSFTKRAASNSACRAFNTQREHVSQSLVSPVLCDSNRTHPLLLLMFFLLCFSFGLFLRLFSRLFFFFELLYSGVTGVGRIWNTAWRILTKHVKPHYIRTKATLDDILLKWIASVAVLNQMLIVFGFYAPFLLDNKVQEAWRLVLLFLAYTSY